MTISISGHRDKGVNILGNWRHSSLTALSRRSFVTKMFRLFIVRLVTTKKACSGVRRTFGVCAHPSANCRKNSNFLDIAVQGVFC
jgi:hypothetical protein